MTTTTAIDTRRLHIVVAFANSGSNVASFLESLIGNTDDNFGADIFDAGTTDESAAILAGLSGDVCVTEVAPNVSIAPRQLAAAKSATCDIAVLAQPGSRFSRGWKSAMLNAWQIAGDNSVLVLSSVTESTQPMLAMSPRLAAAAVAHYQPGQDPTIELLQAAAKSGANVYKVNTGPEGQLVGIPQQLDDGAVVWPEVDLEDVADSPPGFATSFREISTALSRGARYGELPSFAAEQVRERLAAEEDHRRLQLARAGRDVCWTDEGIDEPLITVRVPTFNRCEQLMEVALPSILNQTYENLEVIVVGDHTDEATDKAMAQLRDPRVTYINLPTPTSYPEHNRLRWCIAGSRAINVAYELASGHWIAPADDDDACTPDHIEVLLKHAREQRLEYVWSKTITESRFGWEVVGTEPMAGGATTHGATLWSAGLGFMRIGLTNWKTFEPNDQNMWRRMKNIGVKMGFCNEITYRYFPSNKQNEAQ